MTNPSIWTPGQAVSAESSNRVQTFIASAGQTDFIITNFTYETGTNSLEVSVSGVTQRPGIDYIETGSNSFSLTSPVEDVGTAVFVRGLVEVSGNPQVVSDASNVSYLTETVKTALDVRLPEIANYAALRAYAGLVTAYYVRGVTDIFDGGAGVFRVDAADTTTADNGGTVLVDASGRRWKRDRSGGVNVKWFGADPSGVRDCRSSFRAAALEGGNIFVPSGTYRYVVTSSNDLTLLAKTTLIGNGMDSSIVAFESASTSFFNLINVAAGDISIVDIGFKWTTPAGSAGVIGVYFGDGGNINLRNVAFDLGMIEVAGAQNAPNHLVTIRGNASNVRVSGCRFSRFKFGILKTNESTAVNKNWEFSGNLFENFFAPALTFNTPSGDWDNVRVINNELRNNLAHTIGGAPVAFPHMGGVAGGNGTGRFVFSGNVFSGTGQGLHFEEGAEEIIISGNAFAVTDIPVQILDNNVGGSRLTPSRFIICGNIIEQTGEAVTNTTTNIGIDCIFDATGQAAARDVIISGNIINGFTRGIQTAEEGQNYTIFGNRISDCTFGLRQQSAGPVYGNTFKNCTTGIDNMSAGGLNGKNTFIGCATPLAQSGGNGNGAPGIEIRIPDFSVAAGAVTYQVMPAGSALSGKAIVSISGGASRRTSVFDILWNGSTLTGGSTPVFAKGSGNILAPTLSVTDGNLIVNVNNASGSSQTIRCSFSFDGAVYV